MIAFAALLLVAALEPAKASPAGLYELRHMEMAGGLELKPNGHFRYALSYGAVDEEGLERRVRHDVCDRQADRGQRHDTQQEPGPQREAVEHYRVPASSMYPACRTVRMSGGPSASSFLRR